MQVFGITRRRAKTPLVRTAMFHVSLDVPRPDNVPHVGECPTRRRDAPRRCAISRYKKHRNRGIGTELLRRMLEMMWKKGRRQESPSVQKANYALQMYQKTGFEPVANRGEEVLMVCRIGKKQQQVI